MSELTEIRRKSKMNDFDFFYGGYMNWVDLTTNKTYFIQEYHEAMDRNESPKGIRWVGVDGDTGYETEAHVRAIIKDPEPDPRYMPETPEEHRRNF